MKIKLPNKKNQMIKKFRIPLLGKHNIKNSVAAIAVSLTVGLPVLNIKKGLKNFKGVQRRFNKIFTFNNVDFYDDYAHHPTEIKSVLSSLRKINKNRKILLKIIGPINNDHIRKIKEITNG